jgi:hypothetical protein
LFFLLAFILFIFCCFFSLPGNFVIRVCGTLANGKVKNVVTVQKEVEGGLFVARWDWVAVRVSCARVSGKGYWNREQNDCFFLLYFF